MRYRSEEYEEQIRQLGEMYPNFSRQQLEEAEYNLRAYVELQIRMVERISKEPGGEEKLRKLLEENQDDQELEQGESPD